MSGAVDFVARGGVHASEAPGPEFVKAPSTRGAVGVGHADEISFFSHRCGGDNHWVGIALICHDAGKSFGIYCSLTPSDAREYAAKLMSIADRLDGGSGRQ